MYKLNGRNESFFYKISENKPVLVLTSALTSTAFSFLILAADTSRAKPMMGTALLFMREVRNFFFLPRGGG